MKLSTRPSQLLLFAIYALGATLFSAADSLASSSPQRGRGKQAGPKVEWYEGSLDDARKESLERNVPVIIFAVLEDEEESDRFRDNVLGYNSLGEDTQRAIAVIVNAAEHHQRKIKEKDENGEVTERTVCSVYGTRTCEVHMKNWDRVYLEYTDTEAGDGEWNLPEALVLRPDGSLFKRHNQGNPPALDAIFKSLAAIKLESGFGLMRSELRMVKDQIVVAESMMRGEAHGESWQAWYAIHEMIPSGRYHDQAEKGMQAALSMMHVDLEVAMSLLIPGSVREGYLQLLAMKGTFVNSPLEPNVVATLKRCERDKLIKDEVLVIKLELAAEQIWQQVEGYQRKGDEKGAKRVAKKLLGKKYAETPAGKRAREKYGKK